MAEIREGSAPNFAPPVEEGMVFEFEDEKGEISQLEFLGLILHDEQRFGFFFPVDEDDPAGSSGEVLILEVTDLDEEKRASPASSSFLMMRKSPPRFMMNSVRPQKTSTISSKFKILLAFLGESCILIKLLN